MRDAGCSDEHIQRYIESKPLKNHAQEELTIFYKNREAVRWFMFHPYIWVRENHVVMVGMAGEITRPVVVGADYQRIESLMKLEGIGRKKRKRIFKQLIHIERGVVEEAHRVFLR